MRLNKYLARCGVASRREADRLIQAGEVTINGKVVANPAHAVEEGDWVKLRGKALRPRELVYFMLYKPKQMITSMRDPEGRPCVGDVARHLPAGVRPVGRLDWSSEGLLLLTNDGEWAHHMTHPKFHLEKTYHVKVRGRIEERSLEKMKKGMRISGTIMKMKQIRFISRTKGGHTWWEVVLREGKSRQIRRMMKAAGHTVVKLKRVSVGTLRIGDLKPGEYRKLKERELRQLEAELTRVVHASS